MPTPSDDLFPAQEPFTSRTTCPPTPSSDDDWRRNHDESIPARPIEGNTAVDMAINQELSLYSAEDEHQGDGEETHSNRGTRPPVNEIEERNRGDDGKSEKSTMIFEDVAEHEDGRSSPRPDSIGATCELVDFTLTPKSMSSIERPSPSTSPSPAIEDLDHEDHSPSAIQPTTGSPHNVPDTSSPWTFSQIRLTQESLYHTSYLRPGSRFTGTQRSDRQIYNVDVDIQHVSIPQSFLCGYLRIQGLTEDHPSLTTYFEGELIGTNHTFITKHPDWGATEKIDQSHWERFTAFKPLKHEAKKNNFTLKGWWNRENIFMRWKEHFLVPDHRVRTITGASFEGFYYICYNQVEGKISGIYFHAKSEK